MKDKIVNLSASDGRGPCMREIPNLPRCKVWFNLNGVKSQCHQPAIFGRYCSYHAKKFTGVFSRDDYENGKRRRVAALILISRHLPQGYRLEEDVVYIKGQRCKHLLLPEQCAHCAGLSRGRPPKWLKERPKRGLLNLVMLLDRSVLRGGGKFKCVLVSNFNEAVLYDNERKAEQKFFVKADTIKGLHEWVDKLQEHYAANGGVINVCETSKIKGKRDFADFSQREWVMQKYRIKCHLKKVEDYSEEDCLVRLDEIPPEEFPGAQLSPQEAKVLSTILVSIDHDAVARLTGINKKQLSVVVAHIKTTLISGKKRKRCKSQRGSTPLKLLRKDESKTNTLPLMRTATG